MPSTLPTLPQSMRSRAQIRSLRTAGYCVNTICQRLGLHKASERATVELVVEAMPRRYQRGIEAGEPIRRGPNAAARVLA